MRHSNNVRKFGRKKNARRALMKGLALSLIEHGRITTTDAKARELRPYMDKLVTKAKAGELSDRRLVISRLMNRDEAAAKLFDEIAPKYSDRVGGYTRIIKLPPRKSDASPMALIEFV